MITEINIKKDWKNTLNEVDSYDFYHTYDYHQLSICEDERFVLLVYRTNKVLIAIPIVIRPIIGTSYYDVTSVYGYAGPVSKNIPENFDNTLLKSELDAYFHNNKIVSVFSRLNPYVQNQKEILKNIGNCVDKSQVVNIKLNKDLETQRQDYQRRIKSQINKARRLCHIVKAETDDCIDAFINIYYENMDRLNADKSYYFSKDYFYNFLKSKDFKTDLLLAKMNDTKEIIAGIIFTKTNHIVQYHLSGAKTDALNIMPIKMLIDEMRLKATAEGYKYFNLGGGFGSTEDSLLRFKMSFSKDLKTFCVWNYIVKQDVYNDLVLANNTEPSDYFPAYRAR